MGPIVRACVVVAAILGPSSALAQTTGSIQGRVTDAATGVPIDGAAVVAKSDALQGEQIAVTEPDGSFALSFLPPGTYVLEIEAEGRTSQTLDDVEVQLGQVTPVAVDLVPTTLQSRPIRVTAEAPSVDRGSTELGTNLDREFLQTTPQGRTYVEVLRETPGASEDGAGPTIFGSTGAENAYVIEGLDVTSVGYGTVGTDLPIEFFDEMEVKSGGYLPEFGRSTGGIFHLVLRSGGNEYHGDVFTHVAPGFLRAREQPIYRVGDAIGREDHRTYDFDVGATVGGPILRDRLWFFVGFDPRFVHIDVDRIIQTRFDGDGDGDLDTDRFGRPAVRELRRERYQADRTVWNLAGKLTWLLGPDDRLSASYFASPSSRTGILDDPYELATNNGLNRNPDSLDGELRGGSHNGVLSYTSRLFDRRMELEAFAGVHVEREVLENTNDLPTSESQYERPLDEVEPGACRDRDGLPFANCVVTEYVTGGSGDWYDGDLTRYAGGLRLTNLFAHHRLRYGIDAEHKRYGIVLGESGGHDGFEYAASSTPEDPLAHEEDYYVRDTGDPDAPYLYGVGGNPPFSTSVSTVLLSAFVQDSYEVSRHLTLAGGVRWDFEQLRGPDGNAVVTIPDEIAPRLGASFDPTGRGRGRFFASWGWQYESIPMFLSQFSFGGQGAAWRYLDDAGTPICLDENYEAVPDGTPGCLHWTIIGGEKSRVQKDLQGQYNEEFVTGVEYEVARHWVVGVAGVARRLGRVIEDVSPDDGETYRISNPGEGDCDVAEELCAPGQDHAYPKPTRIYTGLVFSLRKRLSAFSQILASYTLSRLEGDYPGLYSQDNDQLYPNISNQYDIRRLLANRYGPLPGDHTHSISIAGSYDLGGLHRDIRGLTFGLGYRGQSGSPISYLGQDVYYGRLEVFMLPRGSAGRTPFVHQFDASVGYDIRIVGSSVVNVNASVFNFLNFQETTAVDQEYTSDLVHAAPPGTRPRDLVNDDGEPVNRNATFGQALARQAPLFVRLGARFSF